jgi:hypothetical protein
MCGEASNGSGVCVAPDVWGVVVSVFGRKRLCTCSEKHQLCPRAGPLVWPLTFLFGSLAA